MVQFAIFLVAVNLMGVMNKNWKLKKKQVIM